MAEQECTICQLEITTDGTLDSVTAKLPCNHEYHGQCIAIWLNTNLSCPLCRNGNAVNRAFRARVIESVREKVHDLGTEDPAVRRALSEMDSSTRAVERRDRIYRMRAREDVVGWCGDHLQAALEAKGYRGEDLEDRMFSLQEGSIQWTLMFTARIRKKETRTPILLELQLRERREKEDASAPPSQHAYRIWVAAEDNFADIATAWNMVSGLWPHTGDVAQYEPYLKYAQVVQRWSTTVAQLRLKHRDRIYHDIETLSA